MKITIVTETYLPFIAGVSTSTDSIARFLAQKGHEVTVLCPHPVLPVKVHETEFKIIYTPSFKDPFFAGKPTSPWPLPLPVMYKEITKDKTDLVHIQEAGALGVSALCFARQRKIPVVGALHLTSEQIIKFIRINPFNLTNKLIQKLLVFFYNSCNTIMVPTQTFAQMLTKIGVRKKIVVVSNGVNTNKFIPGTKNTEIMSKYNLPQDKIIFFYLGRMDKDKNIGTIIKSLNLVFSNVHLVIAGQGAQEKELKNLAISLNTSPKITWLGQIPEEDLTKVYQATDCFVLMSPYEVQSIVTLQAISCGLPVICSNEGALPELCHDHENGFLIPTYDYKMLALKINLLTENENLRKEMGAQSRQISLPHDKAKNLSKLEGLYKEMLSQ